MARTITIDYDRLVDLIQTFYAQGIDDAQHTPVPLYEDITRDILHQLDMIEAEQSHLEYEKIRQQELEEAARELIEWEKKEGLFIDTRPDDEAQDYDTFGDRKI